jgi:hypothetical protein
MVVEILSEKDKLLVRDTRDSSRPWTALAGMAELYWSERRIFAKT